MGKNLYVFDKDGTLTETLSGQICPNNPLDQFLLPNVASKIVQILEDPDNIIAIFTNQGGVSYGYLSERMVWSIIFALESEISTYVESNGLCAAFNGGIGHIPTDVAYFHPKGQKSDRYKDHRKPSPAMLFHLLEDMHKLEHTIENVIVVGNAAEDEQAALGLHNYYRDREHPGWDAPEWVNCVRKVVFHRADKFFDWPAEVLREEKGSIQWLKSSLVHYRPGGFYYKASCPPIVKTLLDQGKDKPQPLVDCDSKLSMDSKIIPSPLQEASKDTPAIRHTIEITGCGETIVDDGKGNLINPSTGEVRGSTDYGKLYGAKILPKENLG